MQGDGGGQFGTRRNVERQVEQRRQPVAVVGRQRDALANEFGFADFLADPHVEGRQVCAAGQFAHRLLHAREDLSPPLLPIGGSLDRLIVAVGGAIGQQPSVIHGRRAGRRGVGGEQAIGAHSQREQDRSGGKGLSCHDRASKLSMPRLSTSSIAGAQNATSTS